MVLIGVSPGLKSVSDLGFQWVLLLFTWKVDSPDVVSPDLKSIRPMTITLNDTVNILIRDVLVKLEFHGYDW